ncbi:hypothetical protein KY358_02735 [Candidatus Woesearchaeota archaeon]|nr:hypothetical protein [Candidatus Woesearchaeota archaeon]
MRGKIMALPVVAALAAPFAGADFLGVGNAFLNIKGVLGDWSPGSGSIVAVGGVILFVFIVIWMMRHRKQAVSEGYGGKGIDWKKGGGEGYKKLKDAMERRRRGKKQLEIDQHIDGSLEKLGDIEKGLDQEKINVDNRLYRLEEYVEKLGKIEKEVGGQLANIFSFILKITQKIKDGKLANRESANESLKVLFMKYNQVSIKHYQVLERFRQVIREEKELIETEESIETKEGPLLSKEKIMEREEIRKIDEELREALKELKDLEKGNAPKREIKMQHKKIKDITKRMEIIKKELRGEHKEEKDLKKKEGISKKLRETLDEMEEIIQNIENREEVVRAGGNVTSITKKSGAAFEDDMKTLEKKSDKVNRYIEKLREIDRRDIKLELKANNLNRKMGEWSKKEEDTKNKELKLAA